MRILHLISQPPDFTGSGKFIRQIIIQARRQGHDNFMVAGTQADFLPDPGLMAPENFMQVRFGHPDLPFAVAGMSDAMPYESTVFSCMSPSQLGRYQEVFRSAVTRALDRFRPDLIHSHHLWILSALARDLLDEMGLDLPMVTTCHGTCLRQHLLCPHISRAITPGLKKISRVMALNPSQQQEILARFGFLPHEVPIMAGGYDASLFRPQPKPQGRVELVYAGKLCRAKGVPWLLKSLKQVRGNTFRLHLAGGGAGAEKEACLGLARELGQNVRVHGTLSHGDLAGLLGQSHLFVLPSFFEGVPLVLMEALACGCRVLCTDLPGTREILEPSPMVRFIPLPRLETVDAPYAADEPMLEKALARSLESFMAEIAAQPQPDLDLAQRLTRPYDWEKVFERIQGVYDQALA